MVLTADGLLERTEVKYICTPEYGVHRMRITEREPKLKMEADS